jgi:hypothetical protein
MAISLEKRAEKIGIILAKANVTKIPPVRVGLALDVSGSTESLYSRGIMQETVDRLLAVSLKFDDNGELDMWSFNQSYSRLVTATPDDYTTYIAKAGIHVGGGTNYAPVLNDMVNFWFAPATTTQVVQSVKKGFMGLFSKKTAETVQVVTLPASNLPAMGLLVTDGANDDRADAEAILRASADKNVYWQMVGVGSAHQFSFLKKMADDLDNVGFVNLASLDVSDDEIYSQLIAEEFIGWIKKIAA